MFGKNEIVGKRKFPDSDKLLVTSIFVTLQGEGPYSGLPAVFVRLAKCNLACSFCDTYFDSGDWFTFKELEDKLCDVVWETPLDMSNYVLIITGGEPMLQEALGPFLETQLGNWDAIQIETNGTADTWIPHEVTLVVSPKCAEKNGKATKYLTPRQNILDRADHLKFVMEATVGSPYSTVPTWALDWKNETQTARRDVFVSPMNVYAREPQRAKIARNSNEVTLEQRSVIEEVISFWEPGLLDLEVNQENHEYTARYAVKNGLRFQLQTHLYAGMA